MNEYSKPGNYSGLGPKQLGPGGPSFPDPPIRNQESPASQKLLVWFRSAGSGGLGPLVRLTKTWKLILRKGALNNEGPALNS